MFVSRSICVCLCVFLCLFVGLSGRLLLCLLTVCVFAIFCLFGNCVVSVLLWASLRERVVGCVVLMCAFVRLVG